MLRKVSLRSQMVCFVVIAGWLASCSSGAATPALPTSVMPTSQITTEVAQSPANAPFQCKAGVVEQSFENGFMFWLGHTTQERCTDQHTFAPSSGEVWVAILDKSLKSGQWLIFVDDWTDGADPISDPSLTPPPGLSQPVRGFGKIWRTKLTDAQRTALGWATGTELPYSADYQYESDSFKNAQGEIIPRPGKHSLRGLAGDLFVFDETTRTVTHTGKK